MPHHMKGWRPKPPSCSHSAFHLFSSGATASRISMLVPVLPGEEKPLAGVEGRGSVADQRSVVECRRQRALLPQAWQPQSSTHWATFSPGPGGRLAVAKPARAALSRGRRPVLAVRASMLVARHNQSSSKALGSLLLAASPPPFLPAAA